MKKVIGISAILSAILTCTGSLINLICFKTIGTMPLATEYSGGEIIGSTGFGVSIYTLYPLSDGDVSPITHVEFEPVDFLMCFAIIFIIIFVIALIIRKIMKK